MINLYICKFFLFFFKRTGVEFFYDKAEMFLNKARRELGYVRTYKEEKEIKNKMHNKTG